jgi:hypothetical protein
MSNSDGRDGAATGRLTAFAALMLALGLLEIILLPSLAWLHDRHWHRDLTDQITHCEGQQGNDCNVGSLKANIRAANAAEDAADIAFGQAILGIVGIFGVGLTVYYAHHAWRQALRSADVAHDTLHTENRAWIELHVSPGEGGVHWADDRCTVALEMRAENHGSTPALRTSVWGEVVCEGDWDVVDKYIKRMRAGQGIEVQPKNVFPGRETTLKQICQMMRDDNPYEASGIAFPIVLACARYWTIFDEADDPPRLSIRAYMLRSNRGIMIDKDHCPLRGADLELLDYAAHPGIVD